MGGGSAGTQNFSVTQAPSDVPRRRYRNRLCSRREGALHVTSVRLI